MSNLLTNDRKKALRYIFFTRLIIVFLTWVLASTLLVFVSLFTTFVFSKAELGWRQAALASMKATFEAYQSDSDKSDISALLHIADTALTKRQPKMSEVVQTVLSLMADAQIVPKRIVVTRPKNDIDSKILNIQISAIANNKEDITQLVQIIKASNKFEDINVSKIVSSLKQDKSGNVHFEFNLVFLDEQKYE